MGEMLKRVAAPLVVVLLLLITTISMVVDRRALAEGGRDLPWWQAVMLEIAAPIQRIVSAPFDGMQSFYENYVDLIGVRVENRRLSRRSAGAIWVDGSVDSRSMTSCRRAMWVAVLPGG